MRSQQTEALAGATYCLAQSQDYWMMGSMIIPFGQLEKCHSISTRRS